MPAWSLENFLSWMAQIGVVVLVGVPLPRLLCIRHPRSHLIYYKCLLIFCLALPFVQTWQHAFDSTSSDQLPLSVLGAIAPRLYAAPGLSLERVVLWILLGGILIRFCWFVVGLWQIHRYRVSAISLQPGPESVVFARRLINCDADVCMSPNNIGPFTFGMVRPTILLPESFLLLEEDAQRAIVCHELLHVRRNDWFATVIEELIGVVLWFHPAVWWLLARIRITREEVVDAEVVRRTIRREPYIDALLAMAGVTIENRVAAVPLLPHRRHLNRRMRSLRLEDSPSLPRLLFSYASVTFILTSASFMAFFAFPLMGEPLVQRGLVPRANPVVLLNSGSREVANRSIVGGRIYTLSE